MVKNGLSNLMKYIFFVTLVTVLSFSFTKVDCFADGSGYAYVSYVNNNGISLTFSKNVVMLRPSYRNSGKNVEWYSSTPFSVSISNGIYAESQLFSPGVYFYSGGFLASNSIIPSSSIFDRTFSKDEIISLVGSVDNPSSYDENLHRIQFDVYYNTPWLLNNSVVVQCLTKPFNDVLDSFDHFDFQLTDDDGTIIWSESIPRGMFNSNGFYRVPDVFEHENIETQNCFYKITPYAVNGDWGITSTGSFYVGTNQSGEPLDNPYLTPSVDGTDIVGTVPVISTTVEDKDVVPSSYLSSSNLPNITYNTNNYYVYDTSDPSNVPSGTTEDTYVDYTINTIDIPQGDPDLFASVQDFYDSDYKNKVSGILSVFQNLFPFLPDGLINGLSFLLAVIIGLIFVLIAIKLIGLIL